MDHAKLAVLASRNWLGGYRCRFGGSLVPLAPLPLTAVRVGAGALIVFGDYQIAPKPPGGRLWLVAADAAGGMGTPPAGGTGSFTPLRGDTSSAPFGGTFPSRGRLEGVRHSTPRPIKGEGLGVHHSTARSPQGEGFFRPGALLLALFIAFWRCRSGRSETGVTGRRRGLRRGRRSWGPRWAAPRAGRSSSRRFGVFPPTWPADAGDASPAY